MDKRIIVPIIVILLLVTVFSGCIENNSVVVPPGLNRDTTGAMNGQVLKYNSTSGLWESANDISGGGKAYYADNLTLNLTGDAFEINQTWLNAKGYLTSYTETDPVFSAHQAHTITSILMGQWNDSYSWGNHADVGYLTSQQWQNQDLNTTDDVIFNSVTSTFIGDGSGLWGYTDNDTTYDLSPYITTSDVWNISGTDVYLNESYSRVGIGGVGTEGKLHVQGGNVYISDTNYPQFKMYSQLAGAENWSFFGADTGFYIRNVDNSKNIIGIKNDGALENNMMLFDATELIFNDNSIDYDFRVESNDSTHAIFVEADTNEIGFFDDNPPQDISFKTPDAGNLDVRLESDDDLNEYARMLFYNGNTAGGVLMSKEAGAQDFFANYAKNGYQWRLYTSPDGSSSDTLRLVIGTDEEVVDSYFTNTFLGVNDTTPTAEVEIEGTGKITVDWTVDSDERIKQVLALPDSAVRKWCENVTIVRFRYYQVWENNETGEFIVGNLTDRQSVGVIAQDIWNVTATLFNERMADQIVVRGNETELWSVRQSIIDMIFHRYTQLLNDDIQYLYDYLGLER